MLEAFTKPELTLIKDLAREEYIRIASHVKKHGDNLNQRMTIISCKRIIKKVKDAEKNA